MKQEPPSDAKCRDKFLVQSVTITADKEFTNVTQIVGLNPFNAQDDGLTGLYVQWDGVAKSDVQEKKIRVAWLAPNEGPSHPVATPIRQTATNGVCSSFPAFGFLTTTNPLYSSTLPPTPRRRPPTPPRRTTPPPSRTPPPSPTPSTTSRRTSPNPHKPPRPRPSPPPPPSQAASDRPRPKPTRSLKNGWPRRKRPRPRSRTNWPAGCGSARQGPSQTIAAARGRPSSRRPRGNRRGAPRACPSGSWPSSASSAFC
jgi:outer membrane biosynthesis protein TonB